MKKFNMRPTNSDFVPKSWGFVEVVVNDETVEIHMGYSSTDGGGRKYAYSKVKEVKGRVNQAFHGVVIEDQMQVVEVYDPKTKKWTKP